MIEKRNIISPDVTPCSTPGCHRKAVTLLDGRAVCEDCLGTGVNHKTAADSGSSNELINKHVEHN